MKLFAAKTLFAVSAFTMLASAPAFAATTYNLDPKHTAVTFQYTHFGFSHPTGKFMSATGSVTLDNDAPANSHVEVTIDVTAINSGVTALDNDLKSPNFFDTAKFPTATFNSTKVEQLSDTEAKVTGDLTIHGVTKPVTLDVKLNQQGTNPFSKKPEAGFTATTSILRSDFGITTLVPMVSDQIDLYIEAEALGQ